MTSPAPEPSDEDLATRAAAGDRPAFAVLLGRYSVRLVGYLLRSCSVPPSDAEDLAQDVWLKVWAALPTWSPDHFRGFLFQVARNAARDHREKYERRRTKPLDEAAGARAGGDPVGRPAEDRDEVGRLRGCLGKLPPDFRSVFEGFVGGKSYEELAAEAGVPVNTVKSRLSRARDGLRKCMGVDGE